MKHIKNQIGVGMVEVLVALLLLAVGVLGFTALQLRAVSATSEAMNNVQAMSLARDLTERMRANRTASGTYQTNLNAPTQAATSSPACLSSTNCTSAQMANYDTAQVITKANSAGLTIKMPNCPNMTTTTGAGASAVTTGSNRACVYVAWGKTNPIDSTTDTTACTNNGTYNADTTCIVMEAY